MTVVVNKKIEKKEFQKILASMMSKNDSKEVNTLKHCGVIKLKKDALAIQKEMRDEWK
jgi:hypothetical protein